MEWGFATPPYTTTPSAAPYTSHHLSYNCERMPVFGHLDILYLIFVTKGDRLYCPSHLSYLFCALYFFFHDMLDAVSVCAPSGAAVELNLVGASVQIFYCRDPLEFLQLVRDHLTQGLHMVASVI